MANGNHTGVFTTAVAVVLFTVTFNPAIDGYDDGIVLTGSARVLNGDVPYRDFWSMYGPATFYLNAALLWGFGEIAVAVKLASIFVKVGLVYFSALIVGRYQDGALQIVAGVTTAGLLIGFRHDLFPVFHATLLVLVAFWSVTQCRNAIVGGIVAGLALACAALFRHDLGAYGLFCVLCYFLTRGFWLEAQSEKPRMTMQCFLALGVSCSALFLPVALVLVQTVGIERLYWDLFVFPTSIYPEVRGLDWPISWGWDLLVYLPFFSPLVWLLHGKQRSGGITQDRDDRGLILLVALCSFVFILKGTVRTSIVHMAPALICLNILIFSVFASWRWSWRSPMVRTASKSLSIALATCIATFAVMSTAEAVVRFADIGARETYSACTSPMHHRLLCMIIDDRYESALAEIDRLTSEDDAIYVGVSDHRQIHKNYQAFYYVVGRFAPTRWEELHPGLQDQPDIQREMLDGFARNPPRVLLLDSLWTPENSPNNQSASVLDEYIDEQYYVKHRFDTLSVMLPR